jgi:hypothetical protein
MLYEVLLHSSGGERFTIERQAPLADGDTFEEDSESYRVLAIQPGYGPFAGVITASSHTSFLGRLLRPLILLRTRAQ